MGRHSIWFGMILNMLQIWTNSVQAKHIQTLISHFYSVLDWSLVQFCIMFQHLMFQHLKHTIYLGQSIPANYWNDCHRYVLPGDCTGPRLKDRAAPLRNALGSRNCDTVLCIWQRLTTTNYIIWATTAAMQPKNATWASGRPRGLPGSVPTTSFTVKKWWYTGDLTK